MHELAIAQQIVRSVRAEMERRGATAVRAIDIDLGLLEGLREADLRAAFDVEAAGTPLEGTALRVTLIPARAFCPKCGVPKPLAMPEESGHGAVSVTCPDCGAEMDLEGGRGFTIRSAAMVLEDP
ncbi:MAG: hypothetical protein A3K66_03810 [Euryarchaeota archaeon RBG_16_67_27]|nr:MAG: hypothetical protein A3K66_03810 [Euryarchaeota archaeon RBG_16_67_27]